MNASFRNLNLHLKEPYLSIKSLPDTQLPAFTVLTGVNGSGKSHLLQAISKGNVEVAGLEKKPKGIRLFDWNNFLPVIGESANPHASYQARAKAIEAICTQRKNAAKQILSFFTQRKISGSDKFKDLPWLTVVTEEDLGPLIEKSHLAGQLMPSHIARMHAKSFIQVRLQALTNFKNQLRQYGALTNILETRIDTEHPSILSMDDDYFRDALPIQWSSTDMLQLQFANWFSSWHAAWEYNKINRYYYETGDQTRQWVADEQFRKQFGPEPWDLTNNVLQEAGVRYRYNRPHNTLDTLHENFQLQLQDPLDGTTISAQNLSPGEKIFLAVTLLLYQTEQLAVLTDLPSLLLLDEVDAPLHPALTRALIRILDVELVQRCGTSIIMTTHSPSTVALAPPGSVYELVRNPRHLRSIKPSAASQILSSGFVSISPPDVIVITESGADVEYYEPLYQSLLREDKIAAHPPLKFLPASKSVTNLADGGCSQVRAWASKLADLGIARFRGLVDKDAGVSGNSVISVLNRHSFENYLFDPLTLFAYMVQRNVDTPFSSQDGYPLNSLELIKCDSSRLQQILDSFFEWIALGTGNINYKKPGGISCSYLGWPALTIPSEWLETQGHVLESSLRPFLNKTGTDQGRGALIKQDHDELIKFQSVSIPQLISLDFVSIFSNLASEV